MKEIIDKLINEISQLPENQKIEALNAVKEALHEISPFKNEPVDCVIWVPSETVQPNDYNPNKIATPEMKLLHLSIKEDGFTMPIVTCKSETKRKIVDGFHRYRVGTEYTNISRRIKGYLPISTTNRPMQECMTSTIRHNRARGTHQIELMSSILIELTQYGMSDSEICKELGMDLDEVLKLKQKTGLKEAYKDHKFSRSWKEFEERYPVESKEEW